MISQVVESKSETGYVALSGSALIPRVFPRGCRGKYVPDVVLVDDDSAYGMRRRECGEQRRRDVDMLMCCGNGHLLRVVSVEGVRTYLFIFFSLYQTDGGSSSSKFEQWLV